MSGTPSANSTRLMPEGPALSYIFILMVFISPTFVPISGNSVWYLSTFTVRPLYSKPFVTRWAPELVLPSVGETSASSVYLNNGTRLLNVTCRLSSLCIHTHAGETLHLNQRSGLTIYFDNSKALVVTLQAFDALNGLTVNVDRYHT